MKHANEICVEKQFLANIESNQQNINKEILMINEQRLYEKVCKLQIIYQ